MKFTIRLKVILSFLFFILVSGVIWFLSYYNLIILNNKLHVIEKKDDLFNTILEARRYEKNFLLTRDKKHLEQALDYITQAESKLEGIVRDYGKYTLTGNKLKDKLDDIKTYKNALISLSEFYDSQDPVKNFEEYQNNAREFGKKITDEIESIVSRERKFVSGLFHELRLYLFVALTAIVLLTISMVFFLYHYVNLPLKSVEEAIYKIAKGDYTQIPFLSSGDEIESFIVSLNNMIHELNRRSEQLVQSEKLASLGTLTSGVAHELNNPLNNIFTSVQILQEELEDDDLEYKKELLTECSHQVERAKDIIKALLEFSRERSFTLKTVEFKELVNRTIRLIKGERPANISIEVDIPGDINVNIDPGRIQQALINLIMNGIQAMEQGGRLTIKAWKSKEEKFCFQIADTGAGIPQKMLSKVFDPFFTTKDVGIGTGLGLSVTHGIIEQHGGNIDVLSVPGQGTAFTIALPLNRKNGEEQ